MSENNIRKCRYYKCKINDGLIDISSDEYVAVGSRYYHKKCYEKKKNGSEETKEEKMIYKEFTNLWHDYIDDEVNYTRLYDHYHKLVANGESPEYLLFTLKYCIQNRMNLNHPAGFHYFVDKQEIRNAYAKKQLSAKVKKDFRPEVQIKEDPKFTVKSNKPLGFSSIFGKR